MAPVFPGWRLIGSFPVGDTDGVGSWLLHHAGDAMLLELPPGLTVAAVSDGLDALGCRLLAFTASHTHEDHFDPALWPELLAAFPAADGIDPGTVRANRVVRLAGEPVWMLPGAKHSPDDVLTVFRGVAMTGDVELGTADSVNDEVPPAVRLSSMRRWADFETRTGYHVHSVMSAHLNDVRRSVQWADLFAVGRTCGTSRPSR